MTATRDEDRSAGLGRRQFLAGSATAAVGLNLDAIAVAQNDGSSGRPGVQRSTVAVEAIGGGVLLIGIARDE